ncbi:NAD-dependent epimerase/dehydratase family protein [Patescibacteria group bacterium]|nr:MAG: NAD-dependent epimerase/dehydratase family protein [Patescibacteria group bacterium]
MNGRVALNKLFDRLRRTTTSHFYIPEVDGVRFIAIAIVTFYHINNFFLTKSPVKYDTVNSLLDIFLKNGFKGVQIFFVLSGFILALPFAKHFLASAKKPVLRKYYLRRLTRLEPPYFAALIIFFLLYLIKGEHTFSELWPGLILNFFYLHNVIPVAGFSMLGVLLWTLEIEVQFYLVAPLLAQVFRLGKQIRRPLLIILIFLIPFLNLYFKIGFIWLYNYLFYFLIGFLIADFYVSEPAPKIPFKLALAASGLAFVVLVFIDVDNFIGKSIFLTSLFLLVYLFLTDDLLKKILGNKIIAGIGGMCYSMYLTHTVVISGFGNATVFWSLTSSYAVNIILQILLLTLPILLITGIFYLIFEKPCMDKDWPIKLKNFIVKKFYAKNLTIKFMPNKKALVCGAGGFIGSHLVKKLKGEGFWVRGVDLKYPEFSQTAADEFVLGDLRDPAVCQKVLAADFDEVYQLAADMGGAGYIFTGEHDADVMHNSAQINLNMAHFAPKTGAKKIFYSSSACIYPRFNQQDPANPNCAEESAYPALPDSDYGWEKLFSERLYFANNRNYGLPVRVARFHNVFGPETAWTGGRDKAPAAICRKVAEAADGGVVEIWGDGKQTRSFLYIDDCLEGVRRFMDSDFGGPLNIGSEEMVSINGLTQMVIDFSGKKLTIKNIPGPEGVRGRNSDNKLIREKLGWAPSLSLREGMAKMYEWVAAQVEAAKKNKYEQAETVLAK